MNLWDLINWAFSECIALVAKTPAGRRLRPIVKKTRSTIATFFIRRPYLIVLAVCALFLYLLTNPELLRDHLPFNISSQDCYKIDDNTKYVSSPHGNVLVQSAAKRECRSQEVVAAEFFQIGQVLNKLGNLDRQSAISAELFIDAASVLFLPSDKEWREYSMFWQSNQLSWSRVENIDLSKFSFKTNSCEIAGPDDLGTIVWGTLLRSNPRTGTDVSGYVDVMPSSSSGGESKRQTRWSYCNGLNPQNFDPKIIKKYAFCNWRRFEVFIPMDSSHSWCTNKSLLERWFSNGTLRRVIVEKSVLDELESEAKSRGDLSNIREFPADRWKPLTKNMPPICIRTVDSDGNPIGSNGEGSKFEEFGRIAAVWCDY